MIKSATLVFFILTTSLSTAQEWTTPLIKGYGKIKYFKDAAVQPDSTLDYKLVFDIKDAKEKEGVNEGLFKIARTINMLGAAKIAPEKIKIAAALHGEATFIALNKEKYQEKYGKDNPNTELIRLLNEFGVELFVCAQATAAKDIREEELNTDFKLALSALSVLANYQHNRYIFMP
jgi:intracellular sulfur oxidation DsrE/DsrF family protein